MLREEEKLLKEINRLFSRADTLYQKLSSQTQENVVNFHNEGATLPFCIRWGLTATEELLEHQKQKKSWN